MILGKRHKMSRIMDGRVVLQDWTEPWGVPVKRKTLLSVRRTSMHSLPM